MKIVMLTPAIPVGWKRLEDGKRLHRTDKFYLNGNWHFASGHLTTNLPSFYGDPMAGKAFATHAGKNGFIYIRKVRRKKSI